MLKLYKVYRVIKNSFKSDFLKNKFLFLFGNRYFVHLVVVIIATLVTTSNIKAYEKKGVLLKFEEESIVSKLIKSGEFMDEGEELIEENIDIKKISSQKRSFYYSDDRRDSLSYQPQINIAEEDVIDNLLIQPDGIAVSSNIIKTETAPKKRTETEKYIVQTGDTVSSIAKRFNITSNTIIWENKLNKYGFIKPGQELTVLPVTGISYAVKKYDTIGKIANKYNVKELEIMELNKITNASTLQIGQNLIIPGASKITPKTPAVSKTKVARYEPAPKTNSTRISNIKSLTDLLWPASCNRISQYFYWRHHGLDIACKLGTPIYSSEDGVVEKAGWSAGYGKRIIVKHSSGMQTLYAHLASINVQVGEAVNRGDVIGKMGSTGWSTGSHLHFEVRISGSKKNPLNYLR